MLVFLDVCFVEVDFVRLFSKWILFYVLMLCNCLIEFKCDLKE